MSDQTVEAVDLELHEAQGRIDSLEQAVIDGDTKVTPEAIEDAKRRFGFLQLQRRGAEKRRQENEARDRQAAIDEGNAQRAEFYTTGVVPAREAYAALVDATRVFTAELQKVRAAHERIGTRAKEMGLELEQDLRWLYGHQNYNDSDGSAFVRAAFKEAVGGTLPAPHLLHSDATRTEYEEREAEVVRDQLARERAFAEASNAVTKLQ